MARNSLACANYHHCHQTWDLHDSETAQSPVSLIQTAEAVGKIRWRPGYSSQIASSFSLMDPNIHIWYAGAYDDRVRELFLRADDRSVAAGTLRHRTFQSTRSRNTTMSLRV